MKTFRTLCYNKSFLFFFFQLNELKFGIFLILTHTKYDNLTKSKIKFNDIEINPIR